MKVMVRRRGWITWPLKMQNGRKIQNLSPCFHCFFSTKQLGSFFQVYFWSCYSSIQNTPRASHLPLSSSGIFAMAFAACPAYLSSLTSSLTTALRVLPAPATLASLLSPNKIKLVPTTGLCSRSSLCPESSSPSGCSLIFRSLLPTCSARPSWSLPVPTPTGSFHPMLLLRLPT